MLYFLYFLYKLQHINNISTSQWRKLGGASIAIITPPHLKSGSANYIIAPP